MRVYICANDSVPWHKRYRQYFISGFTRHGHAITSEPKQADLKVLFGPNYWLKEERSGEPYLMVNRKFLGDHPRDVHDRVAISWDGFNGRGRFGEVDMDEGEMRLSRLQVRVKSWLPDPSDGWNLILGQCDLGRCGRYATLDEWYRHVRRNLAGPLLVRPYPGGVTSMLDHCKGAVSVHTLNSTAAIEALALGAAIVSYDEGSPVYAITKHCMPAGERKDLFPTYRQRESLFKYLAACQWHFSEIQRGEFWERLRINKGPRLCDVIL